MRRKNVLGCAVSFIFVVIGCGAEENLTHSDLTRVASPSISSGYVGNAYCTGEPTTNIRDYPATGPVSGRCSYNEKVWVDGTVRGTDGQIWGRLLNRGNNVVRGNRYGYVNILYLQGSSSPSTNTGPSSGQSYTWPVTSRNITSAFGPRRNPCAGCSSYHKGIDFGVSSGTTVYASNDGNVSSRWNSCGGNTMTIRGQGTESLYLHLTSISSAGRYVTKNTITGKSGNTGSCTTGAHLHFEIHQNGSAVDPMIYLR